MSLTPKKKEYGSYIYKFFEEQDSLSKKYKCKSCENNIVGPVTNLRKHINTTNENQHRDARQQLSEMESENVTTPISKKRKFEETIVQHSSLVTMGACTPKLKYKHNNPRQIEW